METKEVKFAGAVATYTIESLMHDGKALQSGTSHNFGDGFAKAFGIQYSDKDNSLQYVYQTSWGVTTRLIGAIIMVHGDNSGLVLPTKIAPKQLMIVPIAMHKEGVAEKASELCERLKKAVRADIDLSDKTPGWKFAEYEMKGVPVRLEIGPRDIENNSCVLVRRDNGEKITASLDNIEETVTALLDDIQNSLYEKALRHREENTFDALTYDEFKETVDKNGGFVRAMWCGDVECENKIKEDTGATARCMPFEQKTLRDTCVCCGKKAKSMVYWGRAY